MGSRGCAFLRARLPQFKKYKGVDLVIANGRTQPTATASPPPRPNISSKSGVDVITTGNHAFRRRECYPPVRQRGNPPAPRKLSRRLHPRPRPLYGGYGPGAGVRRQSDGELSIWKAFPVPSRRPTGCWKAPGRPASGLSIFTPRPPAKKRAPRLLSRRPHLRPLRYPHPRAHRRRETILPQGTGYISDVGMTGPIQSVLGIKPALAIEK